MAVADYSTRKYEFTYRPCTREIIDIESMRFKTDVFNDHVLPLNAPMELDAHENLDGSVDIYPREVGKTPRFVVIKEGRFSNQEMPVSVRDKRKLKELEISVNGYTFRIHQKSYRECSEPRKTIRHPK